MKTPRMTGKEIILRYLKTHAPSVCRRRPSGYTAAGCGWVHGQDNALPEANEKGAAGAETTGRMATGAVSN